MQKRTTRSIDRLSLAGLTVSTAALISFGLIAALDQAAGLVPALGALMFAIVAGMFAVRLKLHADSSRALDSALPLLKAGALQNAIFNSANFSSIATDAQGVIQIFNVGAERMLGYSAADVVDRITPADISDPQEVDRARQDADGRTRYADFAGLRGAGVQGIARDRGHL